MRIRLPFAVAFCLLLLGSAYLGLTPNVIPSYKQSDKVLHFLIFFIVTSCFYWIFETSFRRTVQLTVFVCCGVLGIGSEILQGLLPNGRLFDPMDILANFVGVLAAIGMCTWYHKRMLQRRRKARGYHLASGTVAVGVDRDVELGGLDNQETSNQANRIEAMEQKSNSWDENAEDDWDEAEDSDSRTSHQGKQDLTATMSGDTKKENKQRND